MAMNSKFSSLLLIIIILTPQILAKKYCPPTKPKVPKPKVHVKPPIHHPPVVPVLPPVIGKPPVHRPPLAPIIGLPPGHHPPVVHPPVVPVPPPVIGKPPITLPPVIPTLPPVIPKLPPVIPTLPPVIPKLPPVIPTLPPPVIPTLPPVTGTPPAGSTVCPPTPATPVTPPTSPPPTSPPPATCPIDTLKLGACVGLLGANGLIHLGDPSVVCCPVIEGLTDISAAVCLCTAIKLSPVNLNVILPIALQVLGTCGKTPPEGFNCS